MVEQKIKLQEFENMVAELQKSLDELTDTIARTELEYEEKLDQLKQRIVDGYIDSKTNMLGLLADSGSMSEFYEKLEIRKYLARYDEQLIEDLKRLGTDLYEKKLRADDLKISYEVAARKTGIAIENMETIQATAEKTARMSAEQISYLQRREDELAEESERLLEAIREMRQNMEYAGGEMIWPVPANRSALDPGDFFGMRFHPIFHEWRMHSGIDIGAPYGANILAANGGTVVITEYTTGYGNKVVIDHGGGIMTLYAHCSKILVKEGQQVKKGHVVALIGSTGWSTGPHLHFEVISEGERADPLEFVNQKSGT
jgi:murein DD-endopeptidase MepM/ murein hydrolase activator NlpD